MGCVGYEGFESDILCRLAHCVCAFRPSVLAPGSHDVPLHPCVTVAKGLSNGGIMLRSAMQAAFETAAVDGILKAPGAAGMSVLCESSDVHPSADDDIENYMVTMGKEEDEDWTEAEFFRAPCAFGVERCSFGCGGRCGPRPRGPDYGAVRCGGAI